MNHAFIDRYASLESPIHRMDVSKKLWGLCCGLAFLLIILPLFNSDFGLRTMIVYGILALLLALISKIPLKFLISRSALVLPFSALIIAVNYFSGNFTFLRTVEMLLKSLLSIFSLLLLSSTTPYHEILRQLGKWGTPAVLISMLSFMYRYFFLLAVEIEALERGIRTRKSKVSGWTKVKVYANIIGMLLIRSYERAERVHQAMRMRGFSGEIQ